MVKETNTEMDKQAEGQIDKLAIRQRDKETNM